MTYSRAAEEVAKVASEDVNQNEALDRAMKNLYVFATSFGEKEEWDKCEECFHQILSHKDNDPQFEEMMQDVGDSLQKLLTDPKFLDNAQERFNELREKSKKVGNESSLSKDIQAFLQQLENTFLSVLRDDDIRNLVQTTLRIVGILSPSNATANPDLMQDAIHVFVPVLIAAIQYIPIPRLEVSTPEIDLLLESLIIEPGHTVNKSSFLPYRLKVETYNDLEIKKHKFQTTTAMTNLMTIKIDGLSAKAEDIGFWLRAHKGLLRFADEGIGSFMLDERGVDIHIDVEIGKNRLEQILTLKAVRVHVHKLDYKLKKSKISWLGWLLKPLLRPIVRKVMEKKMVSTEHCIQTFGYLLVC